jgi:phosphoribosylformimino-5-aminoimidazole carboxamide ribotide isomerase
VHFELLPAIDLSGGRVVRLLRGDYGSETSYADDPTAVARGFAAAGASWLHVVDLDGARDPSRGQGMLLRDVIVAIGDAARVEVAGGVRDLATIESLLAAGAARVVLATAALRDPGFAARAAQRVGPAHIAIALDVRDGRAVGHGWRADEPGVDVEEALTILAARGIETFEVTAIDRDGTLGGPDLESLRRLVDLGLGAIVASGGIASAFDIAAVRAVGCAGAIVGRALYEGRLSLEEALEASR